ncbi:MAG: hypothetical protein F4Y26_17090 [Gammaproteobacteria bacterium]|nr:hypothetical protein [Gammaproteobacteria bacterium]
MTRQTTPFAVLDGKPEGREARQRAIEAELKALPDLEAPSELWDGIEQRVRGQNARRERRVRTAWQALAASVAAVSLASVVWLFQPEPSPPAVASASAPVNVGTLMEASRAIESQRRELPVMVLPAGFGATETDARTILAGRIATVDRSLNELAAVDRIDPTVREALWRERVELMNALMRAEQLQREEFILRAVY